MSWFDDEYQSLYDAEEETTLPLDEDVGGDEDATLAVPEEEDAEAPYISASVDVSMMKGHKTMRTPEAVFEERAFGFLSGSAYEEKKNEIMNRVRRIHNFHLYNPELLIWAVIFGMEKRKLEAKSIQSFISSKGVRASAAADLIRYIRLVELK